MSDKLTYLCETFLKEDFYNFLKINLRIQIVNFSRIKILNSLSAHFLPRKNFHNL